MESSKEFGRRATRRQTKIAQKHKVVPQGQRLHISQAHFLLRLHSPGWHPGLRISAFLSLPPQAVQERPTRPAFVASRVRVLVPADRSHPRPIPGLARACAEPLLARTRGHLPRPTPAPVAGMGGLRLASPGSFRGAAAVLCVSGLLPPYTPAGSLLAIGPIRAPARPPNSYLRLPGRGRSLEAGTRAPAAKPLPLGLASCLRIGPRARQSHPLRGAAAAVLPGQSPRCAGVLAASARVQQSRLVGA